MLDPGYKDISMAFSFQVKVIACRLQPNVPLPLANLSPPPPHSSRRIRQLMIHNVAVPYNYAIVCNFNPMMIDHIPLTCLVGRARSIRTSHIPNKQRRYAIIAYLESDWFPNIPVTVDRIEYSSSPDPLST